MCGSHTAESALRCDSRLLDGCIPSRSLGVCMRAGHAAHTAEINAFGEKCDFPKWATSIVARAGTNGRAKGAAAPRALAPVSLLDTRIDDIPRMSHRRTTRTMSIHVPRLSVPLYSALPSAARWSWGRSPKRKRLALWGRLWGRPGSGSQLSFHPQPRASGLYGR